MQRKSGWLGLCFAVLLLVAVDSGAQAPEMNQQRLEVPPGRLLRIDVETGSVTAVPQGLPIYGDTDVVIDCLVEGDAHSQDVRLMANPGYPLFGPRVSDGSCPTQTHPRPVQYGAIQFVEIWTNDWASMSVSDVAGNLAGFTVWCYGGGVSALQVFDSEGLFLGNGQELSGYAMECEYSGTPAVLRELWQWEVIAGGFHSGPGYATYLAIGYDDPNL